MKVTPWFGASQQPPVRNGWYDVRWSGAAKAWGKRLYWNGKDWRISEGIWFVSDFGNWRGDQWRGLTQPAK